MSLDQISDLDWADLASVASATDKLLTALDSDRALIRAYAESALSNPELRPLWEHYDILDKIVLPDDPSGWRLRLHCFLPGYFDRPHNHRWTYGSRILYGSYTHTLYGDDDQIGAGGMNVAALVPRLIRRESAGDFYTLRHTMIHSVVAEPHTTSLVLRGPAVKDRFIVTDRVTGEAWWQYGAATEKPDDAARKRMTIDQAEGCLARLAELDVLPAKLYPRT
jgi:hypothetical protein